MGSVYSNLGDNTEKNNALLAEISRLKEQLLEKDLYYQHILTSANMVIIKINHSFQITEVNNCTEDIFKISKKELINTPISDNIFKDHDIEVILEEIQSTKHLDLSCYTEEGQMLCIRWFNGGEKINHTDTEYVLLGMDISELSKQKKQVQKSEKTLNMFFEQSLDGFFFANFNDPIKWTNTTNKKEAVKYAIANQKIDKANKTILAQYLCSSQELINSNPTKFFSYQEKSGEDIFFHLFNNGKVHLSTNIIRHDNAIVHLEGNYVLIYNNEGNISGYFGVQRDITQHFEAIQRLKSSENLYRFLINNVLDVIWILDVESGKFNYISPSVEKLRGFTPEEILNTRIEETLSPSSLALASKLIQENVDAFIKTGKVEIFVNDFEQTCKDGSSVWTETLAYFRKNPDSNRLEIIGSSRNIHERKIAQRALDEIKERYQLITEFSADFIALHDKDGNFTYVSPSIQAMLGYESEELIGMHPIDYVHEDDAVYVKSQLLNPSTSHNTNTFEMRFMHKQGHFIWLESQIAVQKNGENEINKIITTHRDVSWRKKMQQELQESEQRFKTFTEVTNEGIIIYHNNRIIDVNPSLRKILDISDSDTLHTNLFTYVSPEYHHLLKKYLDDDFIGTFEIDIIDNKQQVIPAEITTKKAVIKGETVSVIAINDITFWKKTISQIQKLSTALEQTPVSIVITDTSGYIEYVNPRFTENTGYTYDEVIGKNPRILKTNHFDTSHYQNLWNTITNGEIWKGEFLNRRKDSSTFWELATIAPIKNDDDNIEGYVAVKEDITDRKRILEQLNTTNHELKEANAAKDKFFSIIAHDLRSPMAQIVSIAEILTSNKADDSNKEMFLHSILDSSKKISTLLDDLLTWARTQMGKYEIKPERVNISETIAHVVSTLSENLKAKELTIDFLNQTTAVALCDLNTIRLIIRNLISNAIKFSFRGKSIEVHLKTTSTNQLLVSVTDYGVGISKDVLPHLFAPDKSISTYGTENEKGTGLGLMICKEFIERNNGTIWAESEIGKSTSVSFTIPIYQH